MNLDYFLPYLLIELPGVSDPLLKQALVRAAIDFCQRSQVWQEVAEPIVLVDGQSDYDIDAPVGAQVYLLRDAWVGAQPLRPLTLQRQQLELAQDPSQSSTVPTHFRSSADRQSLTVYPVPKLPTASLRVKACFVPKASATVLPDLLGDRYLMAVCAGVKSALMAIPGQAWSNPALSAYYHSQFDDGVLAARMEVLYDGAPSGQLTVPPRQFGF